MEDTLASVPEVLVDLMFLILRVSLYYLLFTHLGNYDTLPPATFLATAFCDIINPFPALDLHSKKLPEQRWNLYKTHGPVVRADIPKTNCNSESAM